MIQGGEYMASKTEKSHDVYTQATLDDGKRGEGRKIVKGKLEAVRKTNERSENGSQKKSTQDLAAVYEGSIYVPKKVTYTVLKRQDSLNRNDKVEKSKFERFEEYFKGITKDTFEGQLSAYKRNNEASVWKLLSSGDLAMESESKTRARADVSEDGYWGVKRTSERLFDFAMTMSEGMPDRIRIMKDGMEDSYEEATKEWGSELPKLCQDTLQNVRHMFTEYLASQGEIIN